MTKLLSVLFLFVCFSPADWGATKVCVGDVTDSDLISPSTTAKPEPQDSRSADTRAQGASDTQDSSRSDDKKTKDQRGAPPQPNLNVPPTQTNKNKNGSNNPNAATPAPPQKNEKTNNANAPDESARPSSRDSIEAFWWTFKVMTRLLIVLVVVLIVSLAIFSFRGKWSLADALSEESSVQPDPHQVKMVASSSRLIALVGLMGILAIVLGIGYSIVWNLFTGAAGNLNLGEIRKFLFGAATLFAPYLANQLRAIFDESSTTKTAVPGAQQPPAAVAPAAPAPAHATPVATPAPAPPAAPAGVPGLVPVKPGTS